MIGIGLAIISLGIVLLLLGFRPIDSELYENHVLPDRYGDYYSICAHILGLRFNAPENCMRAV